ncbi:uncharacterized protein [Clytia hemisphaerica]
MGEKKDEAKFSYKKWLKKRDITTKIFFFINLSLEVENSLTFATLFVYLKDYLKVTAHLNAFYSIISGAFILSTIIGSLVIGKIFDKTRKTRLIFSVVIALVILGNVLYTIPLSPYLLLIGRMLSGIGGSLRAVIVSELNRSYPADEVVPHMTAVACASVMGYTIGPCLNFAFVKADFWFLGVHIQYGNGASLVSCFIYMILFFVSFFFVSDLSREFDLKDAIDNLSEEELKKASLFFGKSKDSAESAVEEGAVNPALDISGKSSTKGITGEDFINYVENGEYGASVNEKTQMLNQSEKASKTKTELDTMTVLKKLFTNVEVLIIYAMSFSIVLCIVTYDLWIPLACIELLNWGKLEINIIVLVNGCAALLNIVFIFKPPKQQQLYYLTFAAFGGIFYLFGAFLFFKLDRTQIFWVDCLIWFFTCFCGSIVFATEELFLVTTLAKIVPSKYLAFAAGIRLAFARSGAALGLFSAAFTFQYLIYFCLVIFVVAMLLCSLVIFRRKHILNPVMFT